MVWLVWSWEWGACFPSPSHQTTPSSHSLQPVRGVYVWCPGCSHGGHVAHMQEWFGQGNRECPTGCGHACNVFAPPAPPPPLLLSRRSSEEYVRR